jgi:hypothetical protein
VVAGAPGVVTVADGVADGSDDPTLDGDGLEEVVTAAGAAGLPRLPELLVSAAIAEPPPASTTSAAMVPTITATRRRRLLGRRADDAMYAPL